MSMKTAIGLMSGTSMDGIDAALIHSDGEYLLEVGPSQFFPFNEETRNLILVAIDEAKTITNRDQCTKAMQEAELAITDSHIVAVKAFLEEIEMASKDIDVIGFHGQTVLHRPDEALTVQLGVGQTLAKATGIDVVYDMRANDMANGGQGAPLIPAYHQALANQLQLSRPIVFVNIGGISNITYVDAYELIAFDVGPGNALVDQWVQLNAGIPYDDGGEIASRGKVNKALADKYLSNDFFKKPGPKSLDRNDFLPPEAGSVGLEDGARTLAHVTAAAILKSVEHIPEPPKLWVISGGGRHNPYIMSDLKELAAGMQADVIASDEVKLDGDSMEAEAWGYLAIRALKKLPLTFPKTTGVSEPVSGGVLCKSG